jgi:diadenosine tetraphosphatase ApaH/serine/threonine PP2A family protein phosphatase
MSLDMPTISGNHERQLLAADRDAMAASDRHAADSITAAQRSWLEELPATRWAGDEVFMCHATPQSDVACFLENIVDGELILAALGQIEERAATCDAPVILCGHTHIPRVASTTHGQVIVNPGSVGIQAYRGHHPAPHAVAVGSPHARYAIIERSTVGWTAELIAIPYDWESAARLAEHNARAEWAHALRTGFL